MEGDGMTLTDKLLALDERITGRFQKITDWGYKRLGWDEYDFAGRAYEASGILFFGEGVYFGIDSVINRRLTILFDAGIAMFGMSLFYDARKRVKMQREFEEKFLENNGAPLPPRYNPVRPAAYTASPLIITGMADSFSAPTSYAFYCSAAAVLFTGAASYFRNTTMHPPKKKKTFSDALDWAKEKLTIARPVVQEVKVQI